MGWVFPVIDLVLPKVWWHKPFLDEDRSSKLLIKKCVEVLSPLLHICLI